MNEQDNFGRLSQAVALLGDTLRPYVERELKRSGGNWWTEYVLPAVSPLTRQKLPSLPKKGVNGQLGQVDVADLLQLITKNWAVVFREKLPDSARSWAEELRSSRNDWAHKGAGDVSAAVVFRAIDTAALLLDAIEPSAAAAMRLLKDQPVAAATDPILETQTPPEAVPAASGTVAPSFPDAGLRAWRDVVTPRSDVRSGTLTQSQFAADLHEVYRENPEVGPEYSDPREARNHQLIGIAAVGNFTNSLPEQTQWDGIVGAVKELLVVYPGREIKGHNDWARQGEGTACAGMLNDVKWDDVLAPPPSAWEPTDREYAHAFAYFYRAIFESKDPTKLHRNHRYALWEMAESTGPKPEL